MAWAKPYMKLLCLLADGQTTPESTHTAMQYLHDSLRKTTKDPTHEPFQFCLLWYEGTFHIGHSLCLSTPNCPTLDPNLLLLALGEPNDLGQRVLVGLLIARACIVKRSLLLQQEKTPP